MTHEQTDGSIDNLRFQVQSKEQTYPGPGLMGVVSLLAAAVALAQSPQVVVVVVVVLVTILMLIVAAQQKNKNFYKSSLGSVYFLPVSLHEKKESRVGVRAAAVALISL